MVAAVQGQRTQRATDRKPNPFKKFIFRGCWECGEAHSRHECPKWKALLAANNGVPPTGHKGAKDKAWAKWKADKQAHQAAKKKDTINEKKWSAPDSKVKMIKIPEDQMDEFRKIAGKPVWDKWVADNKGDFDAQGLFDLVMKAAGKM